MTPRKEAADYEVPFFDDMETNPLKEFSLEDLDCRDGPMRSLRRRTDNEERKSTIPWWFFRAILEVFGFLVLLAAILRGNNADTKTMSPLLVGDSIKDDNGPDHNLLIASYRQQAGGISVELMIEELRLRHEEPNARTIDIGKFVDLVNEAIDMVGIRGVYEEVFNIYALTTALNDGFQERRLHPTMHSVILDGDQGPKIHVYGALPGQEKKNKQLGIAFWWPHWLGAATADKLLREGSLRLHKDSDEYIDAEGYFQEIYQMTTLRKRPDWIPYHAVHGFWWQYLASTRPDLDDYPLDLFESFCAPWMDKPVQQDFVHNSMHHECRHGIGHATYYVMALREESNVAALNVRQQFLENSFSLSKTNFCEAERICDLAPREKENIQCREAVHHSVNLFDPDIHSWDEADARREEICN